MGSGGNHSPHLKQMQGKEQQNDTEKESYFSRLGYLPVRVNADNRNEYSGNTKFH